MLNQWDCVEYNPHPFHQTHYLWHVFVALTAFCLEMIVNSNSNNTLSCALSLFVGTVACLSFPCLNEGTCDETTEGYACSCPFYAYGTQCESKYGYLVFFNLSQELEACKPQLDNGTCDREVDQCLVGHMRTIRGGHCAPPIFCQCKNLGQKFREIRAELGYNLCLLVEICCRELYFLYNMLMWTIAHEDRQEKSKTNIDTRAL